MRGSEQKKFGCKSVDDNRDGFNVYGVVRGAYLLTLLMLEYFHSNLQYIFPTIYRVIQEESALLWEMIV